MGSNRSRAISILTISGVLALAGCGAPEASSNAPDVPVDATVEGAFESVLGVTQSEINVAILERQDQVIADCMMLNGYVASSSELLAESVSSAKPTELGEVTDQAARNIAAFLAADRSAVDQARQETLNGCYDQARLGVSNPLDSYFEWAGTLNLDSADSLSPATELGDSFFEDCAARAGYQASNPSQLVGDFHERVSAVVSTYDGTPESLGRVSADLDVLSLEEAEAVVTTEGCVGRWNDVVKGQREAAESAFVTNNWDAMVVQIQAVGENLGEIESFLPAG